MKLYWNRIHCAAYDHVSLCRGLSLWPGKSMEQSSFRLRISSTTRLEGV